MFKGSSYKFYEGRYNGLNDNLNYSILIRPYLKNKIL